MLSVGAALIGIVIGALGRARGARRLVAVARPGRRGASARSSSRRRTPEAEASPRGTGRGARAGGRAPERDRERGAGPARPDREGRGARPAEGAGRRRTVDRARAARAGARRPRGAHQGAAGGARETQRDALAALEKISGLTVHEARQQLLDRSKDLVRHELAREVRQMEEARARRPPPRAGARRRLAPARRREPHRGGDRHGRRARVGRPQGADHRPRGQEHPRARAPHRRRLHHRRHSARGRPLVVRPAAPRDRSDDARQAHRGRPHPSRSDRGDVLPAKAELESTSSRREQAVFEANCGSSTRISCGCSAGSATARATAERPQAHARGRPFGGIMAAELKAREDDEARGAPPRHRQGRGHEVDGSHARRSRRSWLGAAGVRGRRARDRGASLRGAANGRGGAPDRRRTRSRRRGPARAARASTTSAARGARGDRDREVGVAKAYALQAVARSASSSSRPRSTTTAPSSSRTRSPGRSRISSSTGPGQGDRDPRESGDRGGEDRRRRCCAPWAEIGARGPAADVDAIAALYARRRLLSHPFRERQAPRSTLAWAFDEQMDGMSLRRARDEGARRPSTGGRRHPDVTGRSRRSPDIAAPLRRQRARRRAARRLGEPKERRRAR